jgi:catechol 2,3-dioxygenase-like lactoylglutathione lyase family enzyme
MGNKLDHITFAVKDIEKAVEAHGKVLPDYLLWDQGIVTRRPGVKLAMIAPTQGPRIEFLEPKGEKTRFSEFLERRGEGLFGICYFCDDYDNEMKALKEKGVRFEEETQKDLFPDYPFRVAWVPPEEIHTGIWIEFVDATALPPFETQQG